MREKIVEWAPLHLRLLSQLKGGAAELGEVRSKYVAPVVTEVEASTKVGRQFAAASKTAEQALVATSELPQTPSGTGRGDAGSDADASGCGSEPRAAAEADE